MSLTKKYNQILEAIARYSYKLNGFTDETFLAKKEEGVWSPAEVYAHIISANRITIKGMHKALNGEGTEDSSPLSFKARVIFFTGRIPKGRKVPEVIEKRTPKINSIAEAKQMLDLLESELNEIWDKRDLWSDTQKLKHPALGLMNNSQWIKFMYIHSMHHLKQLDRIKAM